MYNGPITFDEYGNAIIIQYVTIPKGCLEHYLKWKEKGGFNNIEPKKEKD